MFQEGKFEFIAPLAESTYHYIMLCKLTLWALELNHLRGIPFFLSSYKITLLQIKLIFHFFTVT